MGISREGLLASALGREVGVSLMEVAKYQISHLPKILLDRWERFLTADQPFSSPFFSPAFCSAVDVARGGVHVLHLRDDDGMEGFLPFQYRKGRGLLGHAEKVGAHMSDYFGVVGNIRRFDNFPALLSSVGVSALRFDQAVPSLCPFEYSDEEQSAGVRFSTDSFSAFSERLMRDNKEFIKGVLRGERRMVADRGDVVFEWKASVGQAALEHLISAKRCQFERTGVPDALAEPWTRKLLSTLLQAQRQAPCRAILSTLHSGGRWVASNLALVSLNTLHFWYPVYNLNYKQYSPGHILFFKIIEHACSEGINVFDFGGGVSTYKVEYQGENYALFKGWVGANTMSARLERYLQSMIWRTRAIIARGR